MVRPHFRWSDVSIGLVLAAVLCGPAIVRGDLVGSPGAEVYGHAWVQWWAALGWPAWPTGTALVPGAERWPVIDPLPTWIVGGLARVVGPVAAWNAAVVGDLVLAAVGGGVLARACGGVGAVGAVGLVLSPIFLGSVTSGLTEDGALGLVALALAALVDGRRRWIGAVLLGSAAWCGLYLAWLGALAAVGGASVALVRAARAGRGGVEARSWALSGALALVIGGAAAAPFAARLEGVGHRYGAPPVADEPLWRINPWRHADVLAFVTPGKVETGDALVREHPTYAGWSVLGLALLGGGGPAVIVPAWAGVAACAGFALGDTITVAGHPVAANPGDVVFSLLPFADRFNHRGRGWLLGELLLVVLAARGARRAPRIATLAVAAELLLLSPTRLPLTGTPAASPEIYTMLADLPPGPVVVAGASGPGIPPQRVFYDQRAHGRVLLHNPNRPAPVEAPPGSILVALGPSVAGVEARYGPPDKRAADGAAWWIAPAR